MVIHVTTLTEVTYILVVFNLFIFFETGSPIIGQIYLGSEITVSSSLFTFGFSQTFWDLLCFIRARLLLY